MGSILDFIKKLVNWVGDLIHSVVQWFESHVREVVLNKTEDFLNEKQNKIQKMENPKQGAKVAAEMKSLKELQKIAEEEKKKLSDNDKDAINELFKDDPDFF
jgi:hypothetical protein